MNLGSKFMIMLFLCLLLSFTVNAQQNRSSLEKQRKELNKQIENTSINLEKVSKIKKQEAEKLASLLEKSKTRSEQLSGINSELKSILVKIEDNDDRISEITEELDKIKIAYKKLLMILYRYRVNPGAFDMIFSPENFKEHYSRLFYLKRLQKKYCTRVLNLKSEQEQLSEENKLLKTKKTDKKQKLKQTNEQEGGLKDELEKQEKQLRDLKSKEKNLKKELASQEESKRKLNNKIEQIIREQIAASKSNARSYERSKNRKISNNTNSGIEFLPQKQYSALGKAFAAKKGKLPYPVKGKIISSFGKQRHPFFDQVFTYNNGIDIKANQAAIVKSVHEAEVVSVFAVPGNGNAVMLKHGEFYSTYSNLETVSVRRGDIVKTAAHLGTVAKDINSGNYLLHFEIWEGKNKEDPEDWLN